MKLSKPGRFVIFALCIAGYLVIGYVLVPLVTVPDNRFVKVTPFSLNVAYQFGFLRCMIGFVIGMIVYVGYKQDWSRQLFSSGYTFLILIAGLALCMHFAVLDVFTVLFFPCILLSAAYGNQHLNTILSSKPLQRLGDWSFSIYLIHQPFLYQGATVMENSDKTGIAIPKMDIAHYFKHIDISIIFTSLILTARCSALKKQSFIVLKKRLNPTGNLHKRI